MKSSKNLSNAWVQSPAPDKSLQKYEAVLKQHEEQVKQEQIQRVNRSKEEDHRSLEKLRLKRLILMDESGQPPLDIQPTEQSYLNQLSEVDRKKEVLSKGDTLKYLRPFYENKWNHAIDLSNKSVRSYVSLNSSTTVLRPVH